MAEREGFEPSRQVLAVYSLSRRAPSAARPSLRMKKENLDFITEIMAEEVGFEPTEPVKVQRFSRPPPSTARTPLQKKGRTVLSNAKDSIAQRPCLVNKPSSMNYLLLFWYFPPYKVVKLPVLRWSHLPADSFPG